MHPNTLINAWRSPCVQKMIRSCLAVAVVLLVAPTVQAANEWPQFRYDETHQGSVPASLNSELTVFTNQWWTNLSIPGPVGSPAVRGGIVYIGDNGGQLWAIDQESGGIIWKNATGGKVSGAPAVGQDHVYIMNELGSIYSFNRKNGAMQNGYPISTGATFGSILLHEDILYAGGSSSLYSFFASTRQARWTFAASGTTFANITTNCPSGNIDSTPVVFESWVMVGSTNHCFFAVKKTAFGTVDPKNDVVWFAQADESLRSTPVIDVVNRRVIISDVGGKVYAYPLGQAGKVAAIWTYQEPLVSGISSEIKASPAIVGDKVIIAARNGNVRALSLTAGTVVWTRNVNGEVVGSPAIANGKILVGSLDRNMYMLNVTDGTVAGKWLANAEIESSPAISGTQGFWASRDGTLHSWGGKKPDRSDLKLEPLVIGNFFIGQTANIGLLIKNVGPIPSMATTATVHANGVLLSEVQVPALASGNETTLTVQYTPPSISSVKIKAIVDATQTVKEASESNNEIEVSVPISAPPVTTEAPTETTAGGEEGIPGFDLLLAFAALGALAMRRRSKNR